MEKSPRRRVVITGYDAITPLGSALETFAALLNGISGVRRIDNREQNGDVISPEDPRYDSRFKDYIINNIKVGAPSPKNYNPKSMLLEKSKDRRLGLSDIAATSIVCARNALSMAGLLDAERRYVLHRLHPQVKDMSKYERGGYPHPKKVAGWISSGIAASGFLTDIHDKVREHALQDRKLADLSLQIFPEEICGRTSIALGFSGWGGNSAEACATGAANIVEGMRLIQDGYADVVLCGGFENAFDTHPNVTAISFDALRVATRESDPRVASRPFDKNRSGFVMSSGGGLLVLESLEHAQRRGAEILAEMSRGIKSMDGYEPTLPNPQNVADTTIDSLRYILKRKEYLIKPDGILAHATSTQPGDTAEAEALRKIFGRKISEIPVFAAKSGLGHLLGGAGAVNIILAVMSINDGRMPFNQNLETVDPQVEDLNLIRNKPCLVNPNSVLALAYGFGGFNAIALVERYKEEMELKAA